MRINMSELDKLEQYLKENNIEYTREDKKCRNGKQNGSTGFYKIPHNSNFIFPQK